MTDSTPEFPDSRSLQDQVRDLKAQVQLLRHTNECLCRDNTDLRQGRDALVIRLQVLEAALKAAQQQQEPGELNASDSTAPVIVLNDLPQADQWLLKTSRADYAQLKDFLAQQNWEAADCETQRLMLQIAGPEAQEVGFLKAEHIDTFPCLDLKIINQLWTIYSNSKYGFMIQREIWERTQSTRNLWQGPEFDGYYPHREGLGYSLAKRLLRCALAYF